MSDDTISQLWREAAKCTSCPCSEATPNHCVCECFGCRFHCDACWCGGCVETPIWGESMKPPP